MRFKTTFILALCSPLPNSTSERRCSYFIPRPRSTQAPRAQFRAPTHICRTSPHTTTIHLAQLQLLRRGGAGANAVVRRGSPKAFSLRLLLCSPRMKVCYKPGFSIKDMMLFNNAHHRNLAIGNIFHVYKMDPERNSEAGSVYPRGTLSSILIS